MTRTHEICGAGKGEIRFARTFRLTQAAIDGMLSIADMNGLNATAALELAIAQADAAPRERERHKLAILASHTWRAGTLSDDDFRGVLDMIADGAPANTLRHARRALIPLATVQPMAVSDKQYYQQ